LAPEAGTKRSAQLQQGPTAFCAAPTVTREQYGQLSWDQLIPTRSASGLRQERLQPVRQGLVIGDTAKRNEVARAIIATDLEAGSQPVLHHFNRLYRLDRDDDASWLTEQPRLHDHQRPQRYDELLSAKAPLEPNTHEGSETFPVEWVENPADDCDSDMPDTVGNGTITIDWDFDPDETFEPTHTPWWSSSVLVERHLSGGDR
jgi:hypothetical protein